MDNEQGYKYIKAFSKGQITVPKDFRNKLGLGDSFWLKLHLAQNKIIAEPVDQIRNTSTYSADLLKVKGDWFSEKEFEKTRTDLETRIVKNAKGK